MYYVRRNLDCRALIITLSHLLSLVKNRQQVYITVVKEFYLYANRYLMDNGSLLVGNFKNALIKAKYY